MHFSVLGHTRRRSSEDEPSGTFGRVITRYAHSSELNHVHPLMVDFAKYIADVTEG
jgi:hypothetical protein